MKLPRVSRRKDPASSVSAELDINTSGKRWQQIYRVEEALKKYVGHTAFELSYRILGLDRYQVQRRLSDLRCIGKAKNGRNTRKCGITNRLAQTWYPK